MPWLHSREPGNFQMQRVCEDDLSLDTKAAGQGGFLSKFDSIRKSVAKGAGVCRSVSQSLTFSKINNSRKQLSLSQMGLLNQHSCPPFSSDPLSEHDGIFLLKPVLFMLLNSFNHWERIGYSWNLSWCQTGMSSRPISLQMIIFSEPEKNNTTLVNQGGA